MKIKSLELENFRGIVNHKVYFDPVLTVFAGRNGGGKSTILEAIAIMLSWIPVRIGYDIKAEKIKDSDITFGRDFSRLELELESRGGLMMLKMYKRAGRKNSAETGGMSAALDYGRQMRVSLDANKNSDLELPVFAFYRSNRNGRGAPFPDSSTRDTVYKNAFFAGNLNAGLGALRRYFFANKNASARPILTALQKQNSLLIQLRAMMETGDIPKSASPVSQDAMVAASRRYSEYFESSKSSYNVFSQNQWYACNKLAPIAGKISLKKLTDFQLEFARAFLRLIEQGSNSDESVMRDLFARCLTA